jgi:hypothetical protein
MLAALVGTVGELANFVRSNANPSLATIKLVNWFVHRCPIDSRRFSQGTARLVDATQICDQRLELTPRSEGAGRLRQQAQHVLQHVQVTYLAPAAVQIPNE